MKRVYLAPKLSQFKPSACDCTRCQQMCQNFPCWPTPADAVRLIRAGHGEKLMADWWEADCNLPYTEIVCPAQPGSEREAAPYYRMAGPCVMFAAGRCTINDIKPTEGRLAHHDDRHGHLLHQAIAATWNTPSGRRVVKYWKKHFLK